MKKFFRIPFILVIVSLFFAACAPTGEQPAEFVLPPDSPEAQAAQQAGGSNVVSVDTRPTIQAQYDECLAGIDTSVAIPELNIPTNEAGIQAMQVWYCGTDQSVANGMLLVSASRLSTFTPTKVDDVTLKGIVLIRNVGYFALLMAASYAIGDQIADYTVASAPDWTVVLPANPEENVFWSTRHHESPAVIAGAWAYSYNGYLREQGPGNNSGSISMWAGIDPSGTTARVAILMIVGTQVNYAAIQGNVLTFGPNLVPGTYLNLGNGLAMDTATAKWTAAWTMTKTIGHEKKPESEFLTVGQGMLAWQAIQAKYNLYIKVVEIVLPPSPF